jgi:hypothetical protein
MSSNSSSPPTHPSAEKHSDNTLRKRNREDEIELKKTNKTLTEYKNELKLNRKSISLLSAPITTITIFLQVCLNWIKTFIFYLFSHHVVLYSLLLASVTLLGLIFIPGQHQQVNKK